MRLNNHTKLTKFYKKIIYSNTMDWIMALAGFLMGRVILFGTINPLVVAYISLFLMSMNFYVAVVAAIVGLMSVSNKIFISRYIISLAVLIALNFYAVSKEFKAKKGVRAILGGLAVITGGIIYAVINYGSVYFLTLSLLEGVLVALISYIFSYGMDMLMGKKKTSAVKNEEVLSLVALFCCAITGAGDIYFGSTSLCMYFVTVFLFLLGYKGGTVLALGGSAIVSVLLVFSKLYNSNIFLVLSVGCFMASASAKINKYFTPVGFCIGAVPVAFFFYRGILDLSFIGTVFFAGLTLFFVPDNLYLVFKGFVNTGSASEEFGEMVKEVAASRLTGFAAAFNKLAKTIDNKSNDFEGTKDMALPVQDISSKVCQGCSMKEFCWDRNFYKTYNMVVTVLTDCTLKGYINKESIPKSFCESCYKIDEFYWAVANIYELHKQRLFWNSRISQSRKLMGGQLMGVAKLLDKLEKELEHNFVFDNEKSRILTLELKDYGVGSVVVYETAQKNKEVLISMENCHGCNICTRELIPRISNILERKMRRYSYQCNIKDDNCSLRLVEEKRFSISAYVASCAKAGVSGDSHTFMELEGGSFLLALSDGMGYGAKAREESAAGIELFEDFMCAGFDKEMAINLINSTLLLRADDDMFTTLDICTVNLYTGMAEFIKIGAVSTYIMHKNRVEVIKSSTLPVGILGTVDTQTAQTQLSREDVIVMTTDGVPDSYDNVLRRDVWLKGVVENCPYNKPNDIAEYILSKARENIGERERDDMTVLVAKVW